MKPLIALLISILTIPALAQQMATVTRPNAALHGTPLAAGKVMATLEKGTRVEILIAQGTWHLVQSPDYVGWISNGAIKADDRVDIFPDTPPTPLKSTPPTSRTTIISADPTYIRGPRGGCYYVNSRGKKTYVDRSLCN